jgi:hypothetical protein
MTAGLRALIIALILTAVAWTAREIPGFGFLPLVDDDVNIFFNPHMGAPDASRLHWMATDFSYVHRYMPLGWLGFSLVYSFSGLNPQGYHVAGVLLHGANSVLVFLVMGQLLLRFSPGTPERRRIWSAGLAALLWALHPLRVETTAWCSGLLYSQAGFFALLCACAHYAELRERSAGRVRRASVLLAFSWVAYAASVLTYPVALFLPFAMVFVDHAWLAGDGAMAARARRAARMRSLVFGLAAIGGLLLTLHARGTVLSSWGKVPTMAEFGPLSRLLQACYVIVVYMWRTVWPGDVRWIPLSLFDADAPGLLGWVAAAAVLCLSWGAWRFRKRAPYLSICWICYLVLVTPNLGLSEHPHTIADRYLYFTGVVFSAVIAIGMVRIRADAAFVASALACAIAALVCAEASLEGARIWQNAGNFQVHMMQNPDRDLGHITAARAGKLRFLEGDVRGGREAVRLELERAPSVGGVILTWREIAPANALSPETASRRLQEWPAAPFTIAEVQIARAQLEEGRTGDALLHLDAAIEISPDFAEARFRRGVLLAAEGQPGRALHDWLCIERDAGQTASEVNFMTGCLRKAYLAEGNAVAAQLLQRDFDRRGIIQTLH